MIILQDIFHAVVEVPRWTNAKMEVYTVYVLIYFGKLIIFSPCFLLVFSSYIPYKINFQINKSVLAFLRFSYNIIQ